MRIYLSGPITGREEDYIERFAAAQKEALEKHPGAELINPAKVMQHMGDHAQLTHQNYMDVSLTLMDMCTHVWLMDGWQDSAGCGAEVMYALETGKEILYDPEDFRV